MIITKIDIPEDPNQGLDKLSMPRLEQLVLIAGKNGSGKSRILSKIKFVLSQKPTKNQIDQLIQQRESFVKKIKNYEEAISHNRNLRNGNNQVDDNINMLKKNIEDKNNEIYKIDKILLWNLVETSSIANQYECIDFVPKQLNLADCNSFNKDDLISNANNLENVGIAHSPSGTLAKIQHIQDQWFNATHQHSSTSAERKKEIVISYDRLCEYIAAFLNTTLDRNENGDATIFGFRLGEARLSDGQKVLLQLCLALYTQETKLTESIIFMDEPENHLHPEALIEVVDKLLGAVSNGQIWIATHSINLLAHYDPKYIWYVEDGNIKYSGNLPEKVLRGLIGNEEEIVKLSNFLSLPAQMATTKFSFECLLAPKTLTTGPEDPQTNQILNAIKSLKHEQKIIRILDFGAGKGRLLSTIFETTLSYETNLSEWLDYYAYDLPSDDQNDCINTIEIAYGMGRERYFNDEKRFIENIKEKSFDLVIMCNVFHELDPKDWLTLFNPHGLIRSALSDEGILLIVEDQLISVGEKAYQNGFLVLDKIQFKKLFKISNDYEVMDARGDGRLRAHFIPAQALQNIDSTSRNDTIKTLQQTAKREIQKLRKSEPSYKNGRLHGFWIQQLANAQLVLDELGFE